MAPLDGSVTQEVPPRPLPAGVSITWLGHASVLVEVVDDDGGVTRVLTDPALTLRLAHLRRRVPLVAPPPVEVVAVSHVHMDHLHLRSLRLVPGRGRVVVPRGAGRLVADLPRRDVVEVVSGDSLAVDAPSQPPGVAAATSPPAASAVTVRAVPANHSNSRGPQSRIIAEPVGYVIEARGRRIYFAGDTDLFDEMRDLGSLGRIDVALLPIWGWGPTLGERHLDPARAATAVTWIDPVTVVPIHWGTYSPLRPRRGSPPWLERPIDAFRDELAQVGHSDRLHAVRPGGSMHLGDVAPRT